MVYGLWRALPGVPGLLAPVALRYVPQDLIPASGDQDHTLLLVREAAFVGALKPRCTSSRPPHPVSNVRDDREPPLQGKQDARRET